jgi:hypothetical protein
MESLNSLLIPAHFTRIYGTKHLEVGFFLSYFILAWVLPITTLQMVFIVNIYIQLSLLLTDTFDLC